MWPAPGYFSVFLSPVVFQNGGHIVFWMHNVFIIFKLWALLFISLFVISLTSNNRQTKGWLLHRRVWQQTLSVWQQTLSVWQQTSSRSGNRQIKGGSVWQRPFSHSRLYDWGSGNSQTDSLATDKTTVILWIGRWVWVFITWSTPYQVWGSRKPWTRILTSFVAINDVMTDKQKSVPPSLSLATDSRGLETDRQSVADMI